MKPRIALCAVLSCMMCASSPAQSQGHFFFGTSQDNPHCAVAWLFYLDPRARSGGIFEVAAMEPFSKFELNPDGTLSFQWSELGDNLYQFSGVLNAGTLSGEIRQIDTHADSPQRMCAITASQLPAQPSPASRQLSPARYSNLAYSNEGGDRTGVDIRFLSTSRGTSGIMVFYEGYWSEPTYTPLLLSNVNADHGVIRFAAQTPVGLLHYHLQPARAGFLLRRDDRPGPGVPLKKLQKVLPEIR